MAETAALAWIEPFLDGQLGASESALLEKALSSDPNLQRIFQAQQSFHLFVRRALLSENAPQGLHERIRNRLQASDPVFAATATSSSSPALHSRSWGRSWLRFAASLVLISCAAIVYQILCPQVGLCRYVSACTQEHQRIAAVDRGLLLRPDDAQVKQVCREARCVLSSVPRLDGFELTGTGTASFAQLQNIGVPLAAFLRYERPSAQPVILFLHNWPSESPTVEHVEFEGCGFWLAEYNGVGCASWRMPDGKMLCSVTGRHPKDQILRLAYEARMAMEGKR